MPPPPEPTSADLKAMEKYYMATASLDPFLSGILHEREQLASILESMPCLCSPDNVYHQGTNILEWLACVVGKAVRIGGESERERAAKVAEEYDDHAGPNIGEGIATAIRKGSQS